MARIRSLKPEHKANVRVGQLSDRAYRLWVGLVTEADDEGRFVAEPSHLLAVVFPYQRDLTVGKVEVALQEIGQRCQVVFYVANGIRYGQLVTFNEHQRVNRPSPSRIPPPNGHLTEGSVSLHGGITEGSLLIGSDRIGSDQELQCAAAPHVMPFTKLAEEILSFLNQKASRHYKPGPNTSGLIAARLKAGATPRECRAVIVRRCREWVGDPKMAKYLRPSTLFNPEKFAQYQGEIPPEASDGMP